MRSTFFVLFGPTCKDLHLFIYFSLKKEETPGKGSKTDTITSVHWTEKIKGLDTNDKAKVLEAELKAMEEQLKEKSSIIKCLQEIHCGVGLKSSAAGGNLFLWYYKCFNKTDSGDSFFPYP